MNKLEDAARLALEALWYAEIHHGGDDCYTDSINALRAALAEHEAAPPRELSEEENRALCESAEAQEEDAYFAARAQIDSRPNRALFDAGFSRGWKAARAIERKVREG